MVGGYPRLCLYAVPGLPEKRPYRPVFMYCLSGAVSALDARGQMYFHISLFPQRTFRGADDHVRRCNAEGNAAGEKILYGDGAVRRRRRRPVRPVLSGIVRSHRLYQICGYVPAVDEELGADLWELSRD